MESDSKGQKEAETIIDVRRKKPRKTERSGVR